MNRRGKEKYGYIVVDREGRGGGWDRGEGGGVISPQHLGDMYTTPPHPPPSQDPPGEPRDKNNMLFIPNMIIVLLFFYLLNMPHTAYSVPPTPQDE